MLFSVGYGNDRFVAVGRDMSSDTTFTSANGIDWAQGMSVNGTRSFRTGIAYGKGQFVEVWFLGGLATSTDGLKWTQRIGYWTQLQSVAYGNGHFLVVGGGEVAVSDYGSGYILSSTDAVNWIRRGAWGQIPLHGVAYGDGHFVAVGKDGTILQSGSIINLEIIPNTETQSVTLSLEGPTGADYTLQSSTDLISWRDVRSITNIQSGPVILDGLPVTIDRQFYRAISP
jgi:hypothetical protein